MLEAEAGQRISRQLSTLRSSITAPHLLPVVPENCSTDEVDSTLVK
jgi:hypothetical protein